MNHYYYDLMDLCRCGYDLETISKLSGMSTQKVIVLLSEIVHRPCRYSGICHDCPAEYACCSNYDRVQQLKNQQIQNNVIMTRIRLQERFQPISCGERYPEERPASKTA